MQQRGYELLPSRSVSEDRLAGYGRCWEACREPTHRHQRSGFRRINVRFALALTPLLFTGASQYPWASLDHLRWFQVLTACNPLTYVSQGMRAALVPEVPHIRPWVPVLVLGTCLVAFTGFPVRSSATCQALTPRSQATRRQRRTPTPAPVPEATASAKASHEHGRVVACGDGVAI